MRRRAAFLALVLSTVLAAGCAEPPNRELDQAQGAIDAARAAGADRYASASYQAAVTALKNAHDAVAQRDYRLALSHALDSRERAQAAAKEAADQQAVARSAAERKLVEVTAAVDAAEQRLAAAEAARVPRRVLNPIRDAVFQADARLQKVGTAIQEGNYAASQEQLAESATQLTAAMAELDKLMKGRGVVRRTK